MKIVVVGGGTAGWLAALMLHKIHPEHELTVIESSSIGIVGAGEGSTGLLTSILKNSFWNFDCDLMDFFKETGASLKYGILHKSWREVGVDYYGPIGGSPSQNNIIDYIFAHYHVNHPDQLHRTSDLGWAIEKGVTPLNLNNFKFDKFETALHFDAHAVGKYFKKVTMKNGTVTHVDDEIVDVLLNEQGYISELLLKSGKKIDGDFFIDASGFRQVLVKKLGVKWVSYKDNLPVNSAMPFLLDYKEGEDPELYTTAWAQSSGWMWKIPTMTRQGCGYVFCDEFITPEKAQEEIETTLGRPIDPIRVLKFDTGRLEKVWTKNCLAIGLASAFAEPLEATSIHTTVTQLLSFNFEFLKNTVEETCNHGSINSYNRQTARLYDMTKEFLVAHYMGGRTDSEFWRYIASGATRTPFVFDMLESCKNRFPSNRDLTPGFGEPDIGLWLPILAGTGHLSPSISQLALNDAQFIIGKDKQVSTIVDEYEYSVGVMHSNAMKFTELTKLLRKNLKS